MSTRAVAAHLDPMSNSQTPDAPLGQPAPRFTGSNTERQSKGLPGHCDDCAARGHVAAHPDLGCGDVGCTSFHDEPAPQRPTPDGLAPGSIPDTILLWDALLPDGIPTVFTDNGRYSGVDHLTVHLFQAIREQALGRGTYDRAPVGVLYTATGAHRLDEILAKMWTHPASDAVRRIPRERPYVDPHLRTMERAQENLDRLWSGFRARLAR